jgi:hypothetical protein
MNSQTRPKTAQILQFPPPAARLQLDKFRQAKTKQNDPDFELATSFCGDAWYHQAAIQASTPPRKG